MPTDNKFSPPQASGVLDYCLLLIGTKQIVFSELNEISTFNLFSFLTQQ
jgi:hypothetical protein